MNPQESRDSFFFIMYGLFYDSLCNRLRKDGKISVGKILNKNKNKEMTHTKKPSPLVGEGGGVSRRKGQV